MLEQIELRDARAPARGQGGKPPACSRPPPRALGALGAEANVGRLVLTHLVPSLPAAQAQGFFAPPIAALCDSEIIIADDGTRVVVDL